MQKNGQAWPDGLLSSLSLGLSLPALPPPLLPPSLALLSLSLSLSLFSLPSPLSLLSAAQFSLLDQSTHSFRAILEGVNLLRVRGY